MSEETHFTAARIALCLGRHPRAVRKALNGFPADGSVIIRGVSAAAWSLSQLPTPLVSKLAKGAEKHGHPTTLHFLQNPPRRAEAPRLAGIAPGELSRAQKLMRTFAPCFRMNADAPDAERARIAAPEYKRIFGKAVSDRYLRRLIARVIERDRGNMNFDRLELYLRERPAKLRASTRLDTALRFEKFDDALNMIVDRTRPTLSEIAYCWRAILKMISERLAAGADEIILKQQLRAYIVRVAPFLGANEIAVKRTLNRKIREAIDGGGIDQIGDRRIEPKQRIAAKPSDFDANIDLLAKHTVFHCGKRESQAYRELHDGTSTCGCGRFSEEFRAAYPFDCRVAKSRVPKCVRVVAQPMVEAMWSRRLGARAARLALPSIHRDWSDVAAGESYTSDDETLNHYIVDWHYAGEYEYDGRRFNVVRPQFLPVVDERTDFPLGFSLVPSPTYNSRIIRTLITRIVMRPEIGLPFKQFLFELGIWKARNVEALAGWSEIDESFGRYGVEVRHATTPKAKVIERVIGALQNLDEFAPGYVGRGEQRVKFEREQKFLQQLKRVGQPRKAEVNPCEMLMTMDECEEMVDSVMNRFAAEPQNGERLPGLSPEEGWDQLSGNRAHIVLPESLRFLLATEESIQTVTGEGVKLQIGPKTHYYCGSEQLGALIGEKVRVRFNPVLPELITVSHKATDPRGLKPFAVPLFETVRAHGATRGEFGRAREHQNKFASYGRARYRELVPKSNLTICHSQIGSPELRAAGEAHNRLEREHIQLNVKRETHRRAIRKLAARQNLEIDPKLVKQPDRVVRHLQTCDDLEAKIIEMERGATTQEAQ
jgi:hypothetical protein